MPPDSPQHRIDVDEAARIIYNTARPDWRQVGKVRAKIIRGVIEGAKNGRWTTREAVADYLATASLSLSQRQADSQVHRDPAANEEARQHRRSASFRQYRKDYRGVLREYLLAVVCRRGEPDEPHDSPWFRRAVVAGQVGLLAVIAAVVVTAFLALRPKPEPPELAVVRGWLAKNTKHHEVLRWHPPQPEGAAGRTSIRVIYQYSDTGRNSIRTDRTFVIAGNEVAVVDNSE